MELYAKQARCIRNSAVAMTAGTPVCLQGGKNIAAAKALCKGDIVNK